MRGPDGAVRPHWQVLDRALNAFGPGEMWRRWEQARQLIRQHGVSFNVYGDARGLDRPWPLDPVPVVLAPDEFATLAAGLAQRATLLDRLLADLYGPRRVIAEGLLPPEVVLAHPGLLRACAGIVPPGGRFLHFYAADLVRTPEGDLRVLADRTQAPAGAGYALENRIVLGRVLPEAFRDCHAQRLASFFRTLRDTLTALAPHGRENPRIVLLTAGPHNATYFEQAFLAQYLGYPLVEGGDLTVRDGRVFLKTLGGLHPVDVILRRLHDDWCDPLELRPESLLGVPGLLQAARDGQVAIANALGAGAVETPALTPFLPSLCRALLGEDLQLRVGRDLVVRAAHRAVSRAEPPRRDGHQAGVSGDGGRGPLGAGPLAGRPSRASRFRRAPRQRRVGEAGGGDARGTRALRGATARDAVDGARDRGGRADAAIAGAARVRGRRRCRRLRDDAGRAGGRGRGRRRDRHLDRPRRAQQGHLGHQRGRGERVLAAAAASAAGGADPGRRRSPSRVADNFFWLGRYAERAESIARLARVICLRLADRGRRAFAADFGPLVTALRTQTRVAAGRAEGSNGAAKIGLDPERAVREALFDPAHDGTLFTTVRAIERVARSIRDRLSMDSWSVVVSLQNEIGEGERTARDERLLVLAARLDRAIMTLTALSGFASESVTREAAWRFLDMGRRLERALNTALVLDQGLGVVRPDETPMLEALLDAADSAMTYRRRYRATLQAAPVVDLLPPTRGTRARSCSSSWRWASTSPRCRVIRCWRGAAPRSGSRSRRCPPSAFSTSTSSARRGRGAPGPPDLWVGLVANMQKLSDALSGSYLAPATISRSLASPGPSS